MSFENPESLENKIEKVRSLPIGVDPKADLILVLLDRKPATGVMFFTENISTDEMCNLLRDIGLEPKISKDEEGRAEVVVSKTQEITDELAGTSASMDHARYGELMGYPRTAVDAFQDPTKRLDMEETNALLKGLPLFGIFALSKEHATEEARQIQEWNLALFEHAPWLLDQIYGEEGAIPYKEYLQSLREAQK